ncbi:MAG TPA: KEOPS complex subunit Pcc1 [Thermoplasmata archaeon]|nr:KEOPS complex subunit Pcc1 [Thermoplasmata archaeon]
MSASESEGAGVELTVRLRGAFPDATTARRVADAVRADNPSFVTIAVDGSELEVRLTATSAASARATLEDLLACLRAAERTANERSVAPQHG